MNIGLYHINHCFPVMRCINIEIPASLTMHQPLIHLLINYNPEFKPSEAAKCINFLGMHPTLTQVPPRPHVFPYGDGFTKFASPTRAPSLTARRAHAKPPEPPPNLI